MRNLCGTILVAAFAAVLSANATALPCEVKKYDALRHFSNRFGDKIYIARKPGSKISFKFKGSQCQIYDLLGPDCAQLWITVDGKRRANPVARFDSYCTYYRLASLYVGGGKDEVHTVEVEIDSKQPSRKSVAFRLKNPEKELKGEMFDGTTWIVGKIMLIGDIVD